MCSAQGGSNQAADFVQRQQRGWRDENPGVNPISGERTPAATAQPEIRPATSPQQTVLGRRNQIASQMVGGKTLLGA